MSNDVINMISYCMGHPLHWKSSDKVWRLENGEEYTNEIHQQLVCPRCGLTATEEGHDPCIANLPEVEYACCGHGIDDFQQAYIKYSNGEVIRFDTTDDLLKHVDRL